LQSGGPLPFTGINNGASGAPVLKGSLRLEFCLESHHRAPIVAQNFGRATENISAQIKRAYRTHCQREKVCFQNLRRLHVKLCGQRADTEDKDEEVKRIQCPS
jgi:hypothetical protein